MPKVLAFAGSAREGSFNRRLLRAAALRELFQEHDGLLIASPEYNSSITPLLKNAIDWVSRSPEGSGDLSRFRGKLAALVAASPGPLGGLRSLATLRSVLSNIGVTVLAEQMTLRGAAEAFDESGELRDERQRRRAEGVGRALAEMLRALA